MIVHTVVYTNTEAPHAEWVPAYIILGVWEGSVLQTPWMAYDMWQYIRPEAEKLIAEFFRQGRFGEVTIRVCRWRVDICEALALCVRASGNGIKVKVVYPPYQEDHCRQFTLTRK